MQRPKWDKALATALVAEGTLIDIQVHLGDVPLWKSNKMEGTLPHTRTTQKPCGNLNQLQGRGKN